jgi:CRP/FNR family transcriptional regulator
MASTFDTEQQNYEHDWLFRREAEHHQPEPRELISIISDCASGEREVKAGNDLYGIGEQCNAVYVIADGWVALYDLLQDGRRQILQFALPGALLGFNPDPGRVTSSGAEALTNTLVWVVMYSELALLSQEHSQVGMRLAELVARDRNLSFDHLTSIGRRCARERVARLLLELFIRCRAHWPGRGAEEMQLPLTQEHIADATGLTSIHVNRVLGELRDEGIVRFHYHKLMILNPEKLMGVAAIDRQVALAWMQR